jgi:rare lipoprotein A
MARMPHAFNGRPFPMAVWIGAIVLSALASGCATSRPPAPSARIPPETRPGAKPAPRPSQTGEASWYGEAHHGHPTASGEIYDMYKLTAAHPSLPMGSKVMVTNLKNGKSVEVRINDRGPTVDGRIIDLSYAAAKELGAVSGGTIPVRLRVLSTPPP